MPNLKNNRPFSFVVIFIIYVLAFLIGVAAFFMFANLSVLIRLALADLTATLFVWVLGILLRNSSVYDPYWSVAPILMLPAIIVYYGAYNIGNLLLAVVILFWGIRLTLNWAYTFKGLVFVDWRYSKLKAENQKLWFIINLFGINLMPTVVVFLVMIPAFLFITQFDTLNIGLVLAAMLSTVAVILQLISDTQMHRFRRRPENIGKVNDSGLWHYIRHPNYLGEILMWWGVFLMLLSQNQSLWYCLIGPTANTLMFIFASIPLMEGRQLKNKPDYAEYKSRTGMLLPRLLQQKVNNKEQISDE
jgi:steroid 5-alpha reductase family enzyme